MRKRNKNHFPPYWQLTKPIITLSVSFSALAGYILYSGGFTGHWFSMYLGVLLVAAGSSALNQIQESDMDRKMKRTRSRPLPSGRLSMMQASVFTMLLIAAGTTLLAIRNGTVPMTLALVTLMWYNGIYTPLKRFSPWAVIPGALVGAIPPVIGWTAAGGWLFHHDIAFIIFFFFTGQIPHFWLILLRHGDDYQKAGFPSITNTFSPPQIHRLTFSWTATTALTAIMLPLFDVITGYITGGAIITLSATLVIWFYVSVKKDFNVNRAFFITNIYFLFMMLLIMADALLRPMLY
jgi:protoheme IX farnesyltransferase